MSDQSHLAVQDACGLYVLGALSKADVADFEVHLASCDACATEVRTLRDVSASLPFGVPSIEPPPHLRDRILAIAGQSARSTVTPLVPRPSSSSIPGVHATAGTRTPWLGWLSAAAMALLAVGAGSYAMNLRHRLADVQVRLVDAVGRLEESQLQLTRARSDAAGVRASLAMLTTPDVLDLRLSGQVPSRQARGRALVSRTRGLLFAASNLPPLPPSRVYQLWFLTTGAPVSAGVVRPDAEGNVTVAYEGVPGVLEPQGFAVSIEPDGGVAQPTGAIYLATQ